MKVTVTGGTGKLGRWVVQNLADHGHEVLVFDKVAGKRADRVRYLLGDIEDLGQVVGALAGADAVVHLAAIPTHSVVSNEQTFAVNTGGTFNVHEAAWRLGVRRVVTLSSEAVLGWAPRAWTRLSLPDYFPIDEQHPCNAQDAYGLSKIVAEQIAKSFHAKSGMETLALRPPWIVSPDELSELRKTHGVRPLQFGMYHYVDVRDVADACRSAITCEVSSFEAMFVGSGETTVAEPLCQLYPRLAPDIGAKAAALTGSCAPVSVEKAKRVLNWAPRHSWRTNAHLAGPSET